MVHNSFLHRLDVVELRPYVLRINNRNRKGILVQITNSDGKSGWGDIAPLDGWSNESFTDALAQAQGFVQGKIADEDLFASVHFGFDCAFRHLKQPNNFLPLKLPLCGLLTGSETKIAASAESLHKDGIKTVKVKISSLSLNEAIRVLKGLQSTFHIRVDINRSWSKKDVFQLLERFSPEDFDYVEEPLPDWNDLSLFPFPFALDESLREPRDLSLLHSFSKLKKIILKPTMCGGLSRLKAWKLPIVLSSSYESGVGIWHIAQLAQLLNIEDIPAGLDTYRCIENDLLQERMAIVHGHLQIPEYLHIKRDSLISS